MRTGTAVDRRRWQNGRLRPDRYGLRVDILSAFTWVGMNRELAVAGAVSLFWFCLGLWRGRVTNHHERTERQLADSADRRFREALDALSEGVAYLDAQGRYLFWNRRYVAVAFADGHIRPGMTFEDVLRAGLDQGLYPAASGREEEWLDERLARHRSDRSVEEQQLSDGRWLRVEEQRTNDGGTIVIAVDITELKHATCALTAARDQAQAAHRAQSEFFANMSHEIRTPLNGVLGLAAVLQSTSLDAHQQRLLRVMDTAANTLQRLLSDLLDLARMEAGGLVLEMTSLGLAGSVRSAAALCTPQAEEKGLSIRVDVRPEAERDVVGDPVRLQQILVNLISNAVKFTPGGEVSITVAPDGQERGWFRFDVRDTGIGFDEETHSRLFQRFQQADGSTTRRFGGSGLGLAICRNLTDRMGGTLTAESEPGLGSTFTLRLPFRAVESVAAAA